MYPIESGIVDLLYKHNCVIVPGFGGFVGKKSPSKIDLEKGIIYPPSKHFLFNINLIENDGLLIHHLSAKSGVDYQAAGSYVETNVSKWKLDLNEGKSITIHQLGTLRKNSSGIYEFTQDPFANLLLSSFGLKELEFVPSEQEEVLAKIIDLNVEKKKSQFWKYAAAACLLPIAFYSFWLPTQTDVFQSKVISLEDFNPFKKKETIRYKSKENPSISELKTQENQNLNIQNLESDSIGNFIYDEHTSIPVHLPKKVNPVEKTKNKIKTEIKKAPSVNIANAKFKVVVGCFAKLSNVKNFISKLNEDGFDAKYEKFGTLFRVVISSTDTLSVASDVVESSRQKGYKGWILKK